MSKTSWKLALCAGGSLSMLAGVAQADHLLLVDLSVPNQVTISATNGVSLVKILCTPHPCQALAHFASCKRAMETPCHAA